MIIRIGKLSVLTLVGVFIKVGDLIAITECETVTMESHLHEMVDCDLVEKYPKYEFRLKQDSSYNRASKTHEEPKMEPTAWFANQDFNYEKNNLGELK